MIAIYPAPGQGEDCGLDAPDDCGVPLNGPIELRFDRYLLPKTATRFALTVFSGTPANGVFLTPHYDVLERVVTFRPAFGNRFVPGVVYQVKILLPKDGPSGFRAFDGVELEHGRVPLTFSFRTARASPPAVAAAAAPSCDDAVRILTDAGCADCHTGKADSPMGLSLISPEGLRDTAIGYVAHEASTWTTPGVVVADPPRFGTGMALIDPTGSASSYFMYKLIENGRNFGGDCSSAHVVPLPRDVCPEAPAAERARLAGWFVEGDPMPPEPAALPHGLADLRALAAFIEASTDLCN